MPVKKLFEFDIKNRYEPLEKNFQTWIRVYWLVTVNVMNGGRHLADIGTPT